MKKDDSTFRSQLLMRECENERVCKWKKMISPSGLNLLSSTAGFIACKVSIINNKWSANCIFSSMDSVVVSCFICCCFRPPDLSRISFSNSRMLLKAWVRCKRGRERVTKRIRKEGNKDACVSDSGGRVTVRMADIARDRKQEQERVKECVRELRWA